MGQTVLILGAGTGGIVTGKTLSRHAAGSDTRIILFEKEDKNVFAPSLLWLMVGKRKPAQVYRPTRSIGGKGIELVMGEIERVDPERISVTVNGQEYRGDHMVVSLGAEQATEHDLDSHGYNFYTLGGATQFHERLKNFKSGKIALLVPSLPFKCPAAPYEAAMLVEDFIRRKGVRNQTEIALYTPEPGPMGVAGKELSASVRQMVEQKGIAYYPEHPVVSATANTLTFHSGKVVHYDLLAYTPKHLCPRVIRETSLVGESGWVEVDRHTMETRFPNVYAIGDITHIPLEIGKPLPKAGVFAHYQSEAVARNIWQKINGKTPDHTFNGEGQCFLEIGNGKAGFAGGNFYASPAPRVKMRMPGYRWHWAKLWFEQYWFFKYF